MRLSEADVVKNNNVGCCQKARDRARCITGSDESRAIQCIKFIECSDGYCGKAAQNSPFVTPCVFILIRLKINFGNAIKYIF